MSKVLVVTATVNPKEKSFSLGLVNRYLEFYKAKNPEDEFEFLDLNESELGTKTLTFENFQTYWDQPTLDFIEHFKTMDKLIIASPMYNFHVPGLIKNFIDHISLANYTFSYKYSKKGDAIGLVPHMEAQILATQGAPSGWYPWGNHVAYLAGALGFLGIKIHEPSVLVHGTKTDPFNKMPVADVITEFDEEIKKAAETF